MKEPKLNIFVIRGGMGAGKDTLGEAMKNYPLPQPLKTNSRIF